jgi:serine protease AprX
VAQNHGSTVTICDYDRQVANVKKHDLTLIDLALFRSFYFIRSKTMKDRLNVPRYLCFSTAFILFISYLSSTGLFLYSPQDISSYIVQSVDSQFAAELVEVAGGRVTSHLKIINGVAATLTTAQMRSLALNPAISAITPNAIVHAVDLDLDESEIDKRSSPATFYPGVVGADVVWESGITGLGVSVAVIDSGLDDLDGIDQNIQGENNRILAWVDFVAGKHKPVDKNGHGTHIAGIIANSQVGEDGDWNGIAPGVNLVGVRVLDKNGFGTYEQVIKGIQWVIDHKDEYNIRVINLSIVSLVQSPYWADPLNQAVMQAWANDIVVVVAAGNGGPNPMTIGVPGNNPYVITVGAFTDNFTPNNWDDDYLTPFSAVGPTLDGFVKPDVVAPGAHVHSLVEKGDYLIKQYPEAYIFKNYASIAGTSQASAVVSGIAALTLENNPELTPNEVKHRIMYASAIWIDPVTTEALYSMWQQGAGRVNAPGAVFGEFGESFANSGMDIWADISGDSHYEGFSYYDNEDNLFKLNGLWNTWPGGYGSWAGGYGSWAGGYGSWAGGYGSWAGGYGSWAGSFGSWVDGYGSWAGGYGSWAGSYGSWAGGYGSWAGSYGSWAGGYGSWAGGYGSWAGSLPWIDTCLAEHHFLENFLVGNSPDISSTITSIGIQMDE